MSAPNGNDFWKLRSKHGRDMLFESPDLLWEEACKYFQWCIDNPLIEVQQARSGASIPFKDKETGQITFPPNTTELPKMRAFTMTGLCRFLNCNMEYFRNFKKQGRDKKDEFMEVITRIEEIVYEQKFTGAAAGFLNANIIARDLGLTDKQENVIDFEKLTEKELDVLISKIFSKNDTKK